MEDVEMLQEELKTIIAARDVNKLRELFELHNIVDMALIVEELTIEEALFVFKTLKKDDSGDLFSYLEPDKQESLINLLTGPEIKVMLDNLYSDDIADFLDEMPDEIVKKVLKAATPEQRGEINLLLSYKEYSCGSIMTTDYVDLNENLTIAQAMDEIRKERKLAESISYCYMINDKKELTGAMSIRDILFAPKNAILADVMETDRICVKTSDDQEMAIKELQRYDLTMIPVVDDHNKLVGMITSDDVVDVMEEEATEDIHRMAGINPIEEAYLDTSAFKIAKSRLPWLMVLMLSATISGTILSKNEDVLLLIPALSIFVPMLMDTAGNAGSQASAMVIRGIIVDDLSIKDFFKIFRKECIVGLLCGLSLFIVNMIRIKLFMADISMTIALVSSITVVVVVICAKLVGGLLPVIATRFHLDPAVLASPLIATIVDSVSLTVYFALVRVFLL